MKVPEQKHILVHHNQEGTEKCRYVHAGLSMHISTSDNQHFTDTLVLIIIGFILILAILVDETQNTYH